MYYTEVVTILPPYSLFSQESECHEKVFKEVRKPGEKKQPKVLLSVSPFQLSCSLCR